MTVKEFLMLIEKDIEAWKGTKVGKKDILFSIFDYKILIVWIYRISHFLYQKGYLRLARFVAAMNLILFGIEIGVHVKIGGGFRVHHPVGIVLGAQMIGENFNVFAGAGCGGVSPENRNQPIIGNNVFLYAGAKILGDITTGIMSLLALMLLSCSQCLQIPWLWVSRQGFYRELKSRQHEEVTIN